jgi:hypothetical protein
MAKIRASAPCVCPYLHPATPLEGSASLELLARRDAAAGDSWVLFPSASLHGFYERGPLTSSVSCAARCATGSTSRRKMTDNSPTPFAALVTTPWSQAKIASSCKRVTRSQRAVEYPATKIPRVSIEKACIYSVMPSELFEPWVVQRRRGDV